MNGGGPAVPANAGLAELGPNDCCGDGEVKEKDGDEVGCREATVVRKLNLFAVLELVAVGTAGCGVAVRTFLARSLSLIHSHYQSPTNG